MQQNQAIIVCSVYQSETSEAIVGIIRDLCPSEEVVFQPLEKTPQFNGSKVVFCHSSCSGRLALTDVNDSIYDKAVKNASSAVGKENVAFVVTDVEATDVYLRRKMITQTQHTLVSKTNLLLLIGKVDDIDDEVLGQLKRFLTMIRLPQHDHYNSYPQQVNQPPYYDLLKFLPQLACMVIIIACLVSVISRLDIFESHINMLRQESFDRIHRLERTLKVALQSELETKMEDMRSQINDVQSNVLKLQTELQSHSNVQSTRADHIDQTLIDLQQRVNMTLKMSIDKTTLKSLFQDSMNEYKEFQNELKNEMKGMQGSLTENMEYLNSKLHALASQITSMESGVQTAINLLNKLQIELQNHSSVQRHEFAMLTGHIDQKNILLQQSENKTLELCIDKTTLESLWQDSMNNSKVQVQNVLDTKMKDMQRLFDENIEDNRLNLTAFANQITGLQTGIKERHSKDQGSQYSELINITKNIQNNVQTRMNSTSQLQAELNSTIRDMQTKIEGHSSELLGFGRSVQSIHTGLQHLQDSVEKLKSEFKEFITSRVRGQWEYINNSFEYPQTSFQKRMEELKTLLQSIESKIKDD